MVVRKLQKLVSELKFPEISQFKKDKFKTFLKFVWMVILFGFLKITKFAIYVVIAMLCLVLLALLGVSIILLTLTGDL
jgi:hypothetical protein